MGKPPAIVIIVRHGARLDAEDASWHTTASAPYDTPLSYGGWTQTRALGARIASLLHARDLANNEDSNSRRTSENDLYSGNHNAPSPSPGSRRNKQRILIHSSPFLRCVQSSIAIAAGMAQYTGNLQKFEAGSESAAPQPRLGPRLSSAQSRAQTLDSSAFEARYGKKTTFAVPTTEPQRPQTGGTADSFLATRISKPRLRIDAFLGEWLSPEYFEFITPPPPSNMMVAGAKAELIRAAEPVQGAKLELEDKSTFQSWQGWGEFTSAQADSPADLLDMKQFADALPSVNQASKPVQRDSIITSYTPPTPLYALSPSEPIPRGYVSHARDACIDIDYQWDSMRDPQNWGDGGQHGEEWSQLHNRFRQGIRNMIDWYKTQESSYDPQSLNGQESYHEDRFEEDEESILILVTHGAGCNALIGALTNQPVLMDVGMASLTMAVHKTRFDSASAFPAFRRGSITSGSPVGQRRRSSVDIGLSQEYEMKLIASSEHLRAGADPLKIPQLQTSHLATISERGRQDTVSSVGSVTTETARQKNSALGSIRRSTVNSRSSRSYTGMSGRSASPVPSLNGAGLWTDRRPSTAVTEDEDPPSPKSESTDVQSAPTDEIRENPADPFRQSGASLNTAATTSSASTSTATSTWQPKKPLARAGTVGHGGLWGGSGASGPPRAGSLATVSSQSTVSAGSRSRAFTTTEKL